ncbi:tRNA cyclic N6-threonylcarbamoyladenosine(37) synthase TcdA [Thiothrix eikelboomii]|uniref:tRNA A37 threonylcarbamoyladenosine dehydratase n=1 Tax=Thiothrix eikelboomii TaxID=92487 RepID=A0A1T4XLZ8_9GAMM|nr:tRNA cyclic N6-threonylcarbamoyladenosine(37) synthase TcdA [Thiothrix eikelboomii]SKA90403.1 tRNA A37 threonylcarbamoyladenosine dehydratase [Thiothrix eikelboomii]
MQTEYELDISRRFGGIARTYGARGLDSFQAAHVCVVGVGGVGSWAVEALARSAIGRLTLIDLDNVSESNINRQLPALSSTIGAPKIEVLKARILDINPSCQVDLIEDFIELATIPQFIHTEMDYVIDCIDNFRVKAGLIAYCKRHKIRIISLGGAGGQRDPSQIRVGDLARSQQDPLLARVRKQLRQDYHFSRNPKRRFEVACVWSEEQMRFPTAAGAMSTERPSDNAATGLSCAGGLGSVMTVTASFALFAVSHVLEKLATRPQPQVEVENSTS